MRWVGLALGVAAAALLANAARAATPSCAELASVALPHAKVMAATNVTAGQLRACRIEVTAAPTPDSDIRIEVWIPEGGAWNRRYLQLGNGDSPGPFPRRG